jgi:heptosyltransferase-2
MNDHRCMRDIPASDVVEVATRVLAEAGIDPDSSFRAGA